MKILIVDDSRAIQTIVRRAIEKSDLENPDFKTALNGQEALATIKEWKPEIVLTDWHMPTMTGIELLQQMRLLGLGQTIVGFVTTESAPEQIDEVIKSGASFVVHKPFKDAELVDAIRNALLGKSGSMAKPAENIRTKLKAYFDQQLATEGSLESVHGVPIDLIPLPYVIGVFVKNGSKSVSGICLLDLKMSLLLGGHRLHTSVADMKTAISTNTITEAIYKSTISVLGNVAPVIFPSYPEIMLSGSYLVQKPSPKLLEIMNHSKGRLDFKYGHSNLPYGLISILPN